MESSPRVGHIAHPSQSQGGRQVEAAEPGAGVEDDPAAVRVVQLVLVEHLLLMVRLVVLVLVHPLVSVEHTRVRLQ